MLARSSLLRVTVPIKPIVAPHLSTPITKLPPLPPLRETIDVDPKDAVKFFTDMTRIRRLEVVSDQAYKDKKIRGFCHLYLGQEAICVGMQHAMTNEDCIVTGYRDHGWHLVRGGTPFEVFAEMFGKQGGCSKGKGGSMHFYKVKNNYYGGNGIVGAQVPLGAGLAWSFALRNGVQSPKHVAVTLYGDGAANQGQVFEAYNIAALHKLPCIFICENNHFGMGTSESRAAANPSFHQRCEYIPGVKVDGMNVFQVAEITRYAKEWCLQGNGPIIIEYDTYRYVGHSMSDPDVTYRTKADIKAIRDSRDPILHIKTTILNNKWASEDELAAIEAEIKSDIAKQVADATAAEPSRMSEQVTDILVDQRTYYPTGVRHCQGTKMVTF